MPRAWKLIAVVLSLTGCVGGAVSQRYVLSEPVALSAAGMTFLQVEPASLPAYLDNASILVRRGSYALVSSRTGHWGERLSLGITHALGADLARKLPAYRVGFERAAAPGGIRLQLDVDSFDLYPDGHCVLAAGWAVVQKSGAAPSAVGQGVFEIPASKVVKVDDEVLVAAMAGAIGQLADAIAATL